MIQITLKEHGSFPPKEKTTEPETIEKIKNLKEINLDEQDKKLQNILKDVLSISIDPVNNTLQFKANSRIGFAQFSKFAVEITPKFSGIKKLMELMNYVYNLDLKIFEESETMFVGEQNCVSEIIISSFVKKCHHLFRQGLVKSYDLQEDNLPVLRGKLSLSRQILNHVNTKLQFACEYDEFEHNNLENQIILFCLKQSYYVTKNEERKNEIRQLLQIISNLVIFREIRDDDFDKISYNQMNTHYKKIHELCKLIVHNTQITDFNNQGLRYINSFFVDMNTIFQKFIFKLFDDFYPHTVKEEVEYGSWETENKKIIKNRIDILIQKKDTIHAIIDVKYKDELSSDNLNQLEHYMLDHKKTEAYAILPDYGNDTSDTYKSLKQDIHIKIRRIKIDDILDMINEKDFKIKYQKIKNELVKLIPC